MAAPNTTPLDADARAKFLVLSRSFDAKAAFSNDQDRAAFSMLLLGFSASQDALSVAPAAVEIAPVSDAVKTAFRDLFRRSRETGSGPLSSQSTSMLMIAGIAVGAVAGFALAFAFGK